MPAAERIDQAPLLRIFSLEAQDKHFVLVRSNVNRSQLICHSLRPRDQLVKLDPPAEESSAPSAKAESSTN